MQAAHSVINLNCFSKDDQNVSKFVAFSFSGHTRCTLSNRTFDELLAQRVNSKLPCIIARVKDIEGNVHVFEGCAADTLGSFKQLGFFKVSLDAEWKACSYIQYFTLVGITFANHQLFHNFSQVRKDTFFTLQGELFMTSKKPDFASAKKYLDKALKENPKDVRALELLGKLFFYGKGVPQDREKAKEYLELAHKLNPQSKFVSNRLAELEQSSHEVVQEAEDVVTQLDALSLEHESSGTESEAPQDASEVPGMADALASDDRDCASTGESQKNVVASEIVATKSLEQGSVQPKKSPCNCALL